jgi:glutamate synthase (NADPH/NADH) small chain
VKTIEGVTTVNLGQVSSEALSQLGAKLTDRGNVWWDENWMTSVPGVFTAGDMQRGQSLIVWAIAEGRSPKSRSP